MKKRNSPDQQLEKNVAFFSRWAPLLLFLAAFIVYSKTINYEYASDDAMYTYENLSVQKGFGGIPLLLSEGSLKSWNGNNSVYYRPLTLITFAIEKAFFGDSTRSGHLINVLLYAVLILVLYRFLCRLFKELNPVIPFSIALLFALHPLHTEVVANIKSRDELLCMLMGILSLDFLFRYTITQNKRWIIYSCITFFLSIISKENGFAYPAVMILMIYFFTTMRSAGIFKTILPFLLVAGLVMAIRTLILDSNSLEGKILIVDNSLMAAKNMGDQLATNFTILLHALQLLVAPITLSWDYTFNQFPIVSWGNYKAVISLLIHLTLLGIAIAGLRRKSIFSFAILFYFITYFLNSNLFIKTASTFGERFLFTPSLGYSIALGILLCSILRIDTKSKRIKDFSLYFLFIGIISLLYSFKTMDRNKVWENDFTLHESGIVTAPNSAWTHYVYAKDYCTLVYNSNDIIEKEKAAAVVLEHYNRVLEIYPDFESTHYEMAIVYAAINDTMKAIDQFKRSIQTYPEYTPAYTNLAIIYLSRGDYEASLQQFKTIITREPGNLKALKGMGVCYLNLKDSLNAAGYFEKALLLEPGNEQLRSNLATIYTSLGDTAKASLYRRQ